MPAAELATKGENRDQHAHTLTLMSLEARLSEWAMYSLAQKLSWPRYS